MSSRTLVLVIGHRDRSEPPRLAWVDDGARLGRGSDCALVLDDAKVSTRHAIVEDRGDVFQLVDQRSFNGVWFDGVRVPSCPLTEGHAVAIGPFRLVPVRITSPRTLVLELETDEQARTLVARLPCHLRMVQGRPELSDVPDADPVVLFSDDEGLGAIRLSQDGEPEILRPDQDDDGIDLAHVRVRGRRARDFSLLPTDLAFDGDALRPRYSVIEDASPVASIPLDAETLDDDAIAGSDVPIERCRFLALGGGLGSFCWVDALRIHGVGAPDIRVVGFETVPYARYARLCAQSQIPLHERLRSNSESCPDNLWGFPGYAPREAWSYLCRLRLAASVRTLWSVFGEPDASATYTPRAGDVFASIDREAARIGWPSMLRQGRIRLVRRRTGGGYAVLVSGDHPRWIVAEHVHLALGYPGVRFLDDLRTYREQTRDFRRVVNAYEDHEHVYDNLVAQGGGTILLRGRGIVASRILQRLHEVRQSGADVRVLHLMRSRKTRRDRAGLASRPVSEHWSFQPFNWPEAAWSGDLRRRMLRAPAPRRQQYLRAWGGTTTADRPDWQRIVRRGLSDGWYRQRFGEVQRLENTDAAVVAHMTDADEPAPVDAVIDATGLVAGVHGNPVLDELIQHHGLSTTPQGGLATDDHFEIPDLRSGAGRAFAAGVTASGNHYAPVDSFLGLQHAAIVTMDRLDVRPLTPERSLGQWVRWVRGVAP